MRGSVTALHAICFCSAIKTKNTTNNIHTKKSLYLVRLQVCKRHRFGHNTECDARAKFADLTLFKKHCVCRIRQNSMKHPKMDLFSAKMLSQINDMANKNS